MTGQFQSSFVTDDCINTAPYPLQEDISNNRYMQTIFYTLLFIFFLQASR
ncbi:hypothetical protein Hanom_Chr07g00612241 [Helianthus anomalus]